MQPTEKPRGGFYRQVCTVFCTQLFFAQAGVEFGICVADSQARRCRAQQCRERTNRVCIPSSRLRKRSRGCLDFQSLAIRTAYFSCGSSVRLSGRGSCPVRQFFFLFFFKKDEGASSSSIIRKWQYSWSCFASLCASLQNFRLELCAGFHFSWCTREVPVEYPTHVLFMCFSSLL